MMHLLIQHILNLSNSGPSITVPNISTHAGTKHTRSAGLPTFFKSEIPSDKPALVRIITNAICHNSPEISSMDHQSNSMYEDLK